MTAYQYPSFPAVDPATNQIVRNATGQLFAPTDTARAVPLSFRSLSGVAMSTLPVGPLGISDQFEIDDQSTVIWKSGQYEILLWSPLSIIGQAVAAATAAQAAGDLAQAAQTAIASELAGKADLVNGTVPAAQLPAGAGGAAGAQIVDGTLATRPVPVGTPVFIRSDVEPSWMGLTDVRIGA